MMEEIKLYLLRLTLTALLCGIVSGFVKADGPAGKAVKLLTGVAVALTMLMPLVNYRTGFLPDISGQFQAASQDAAADGKKEATEAWAAGIKQAAETYILDKASQYDAHITALVTVTQEDIPVPASVQISGSISPYGKKMLQMLITQNLGIAKEDQIWTQ